MDIGERWAVDRKEMLKKFSVFLISFSFILLHTVKHVFIKCNGIIDYSYWQANDNLRHERIA
jgi:hypothetical protein